MSMAQFEEFAKDHGIEVTAHHVQARTDRAPDVWDRTAIHFHITVTCQPGGQSGKPPAVLWAGFYSVGAAYPVHWAKTATRPDRFGRARPYDQMRRLYSQLQNKHAFGRITLHDESLLESIRDAYCKAAPIEAGDILYSLQSDSRDWESTFDMWAGDMGMDTDSRKALAMYEACQHTAKTILAVLGREQFDRFLELEEE